MTLREQADTLLEDLRNGKRFNRETLISVLGATVPYIADEIPEVALKTPYKPEEEATPVRFTAKNWGQYGGCKRCLKSDTPDGTIVVKIHGKGWWHDECYKAVNPAFYHGL